MLLQVYPLHSSLYRHLSTAIKNSLIGPLFLDDPASPPLLLISTSTSLPKSLPLLSTCHPNGPQSQSAQARYRIDAPSGRLAITESLLLNTPFVKPMFSNVSGDVTSQHSCCSCASMLLLLLDVASGNSSLCALMGFAEGWESCGRRDNHR